MKKASLLLILAAVLSAATFATPNLSIPGRIACPCPNLNQWPAFGYDPGDVGTDLKHILWYSTIAGEFVLLLRLLFLRMGREYRCFCAYLLVSVLQSIALVIASRSGPGFGRNLYGYTWAFTEPVLIAALIAFTLECYGLVYHHYPGVDDRSPLINRILIVGGAICVASLYFPIFGARIGSPASLCFLHRREDRNHPRWQC